MHLIWRRLLFAGIGIFPAFSPFARAFTREVYVWQRQITPPVYQAIREIGGEADGFAILAAEVAWRKDGPQLFRSSPDYGALAAGGRAIGLVIRIGPYTGGFAADDKAARYLQDLVLSVLGAARTGGMQPTELQIDFDCASSKLGGYRLWLEALRKCMDGTKLVITALPDWLGRRDFVWLAGATDGYVLQVHSLEKPSGPDEGFQPCDSDRAWKWIMLAGRFGVPFRVALPTYGYRLAFDADGKFIALAAEGPVVSWPAGAQIRSVRSNAPAMAALARKLVENRPPACTGIIWFRLPVAGDRLNWSVTTLKVLLRGGVPLSRLTVEATRSMAGAANVILMNRGEVDEPLPAKVMAHWNADAVVQAADGLGGYSMAPGNVVSSGVGLTRAPDAADECIAPGQTKKIAWIRFSHETPLAVEIQQKP